MWRFPSINDVLANVLGALVGSISFSLWGPKWLGAVSILVKRGLEYFSTGKLILALVGYATMTFLLTILLQQTTALSNWEENLHLLVGNEPGGNRPWSGHVHELKIVNRAISEREVEMVFSENGLFHLGDPSLICSYRLSGGPSYVDQSEQLPDLVWRGSRREEQKGKMGSVGSDHWLETIEPVNWLSKRTKETSQFTLSARLTAVGESPVESYVVSLSRDPDHCNFVLAQAGAHLVFRLRTPLTGDNGRHPQLVVPDVFLEQKSRQLLVTYDGSQLWFYFDQPARQYSMELGPWLAFFRHIFPSNWSTPGDMAAFKALYYVMLFAPLGFIGALIGNPSRARSACGILFVSAAIALPPVVLEGILQATSGKFLSTDNLFLGMGVSCVAAFFSETLRRT